MKSQITLVNERGFLLPEIMLSFGIMTLLLVSTLTLNATMQNLRQQAVEHLEKLEEIIPMLASTTLQVRKLYGNDGQEISVNPITLLFSDYGNAWSADSCNSRIEFEPTKVAIYVQGLSLGVGNISTDLEVRNGIAYITANGSTASLPDLIIADMHDPATPSIVSSLNTGPGLAALTVAGHYIYGANLSTTNQLQVIDIAVRSSPSLVSKYKLPLPNASSSAPLASAIFYNKEILYLGTQKWDGMELSIIDVSTPTVPQYLGGYETNTLVNDIYVRDGLAYVAASDTGQLRILDVHDPAHVFEITNFSPSGWATQVGKTVSYFEEQLSLGRTTGGFNVVTNHEVFLFSTTSPRTIRYSHDIPGGVYGMLLRPPYIFLSTRSPTHELQVWSDDLSHLVYEKSLGFLPTAMSCDGNILYFATGDAKGIAVVKII